MGAVDIKARQRSNYARQLRRALEETGTSVYRLSRVLNPQQPESARSNIQRYLAEKVLPGIESRYEIAEALGRPELKSVEGDDDDEEADPAMVSALMAVVKSLRAELERERV